MCVTNILFYFLTAYKFVSAPSVEKEAGNTSRLHFTVYVKLFSLTGLSWVLQIVDIVLYMHNTLLMACKGCSYFLVMFVIREHGKCMLMYATRKIARTHRQILVLTLKTQQYKYFKK